MRIIRGEKFGWHSESAKVDFKKLRAHIKSVIAEIAPNDSVERFEKLGVTVIKAEGQFIDKDTVKAGSKLIKAKRLLFLLVAALLFLI